MNAQRENTATRGTALVSLTPIAVENFEMIKDLLANAAMYIGVPLSTLWIWHEFKDGVHLISYLCNLQSNNQNHLGHSDKVFSPSIFNVYPKYDLFE